MKSPLALIAGRGLALTVLSAASLAVSLAGCGQPGPLYMPKLPVRAARATPAPSKPAVPTPPADPTQSSPANDVAPSDPTASPITTQPVPVQP